MASLFDRTKSVQRAGAVLTLSSLMTAALFSIVLPHETAESNAQPRGCGKNYRHQLLTC